MEPAAPIFRAVKEEQAAGERVGKRYLQRANFSSTFAFLPLLPAPLTYQNIPL
jgi:hypothetical protein